MSARYSTDVPQKILCPLRGHLLDAMSGYKTELEDIEVAYLRDRIPDEEG